MGTPTRLDYCQYLLSSQINYTITHFADHSERFSHDIRAYEGVNTGGLNGCYWIRILKRLTNGEQLIENLHDVGRKKVEHVQATIEPDLVYPLLRGRDVQRWKAEPSTCIILANRTDKLAGIPEAEMKREYPKTYAYFKRFEQQLRQRSGYRKFFKNTDPFWSRIPSLRWNLR